MILAINALGLMILVGWTREMTLAQGAIVGTAVYLTSWIYRPDLGGLGWPFLLAALMPVAVAAALYAVVALASVRLAGMYVMMLTLGLQFMLERVVFNIGRLTGAGFEPLATPRPSLLGIDLHSDRAFYYYFLLAVLAAVLLAMVRLRRSHYGRSLLLVGFDHRAATALGISPRRYKTFAFAACGVLAGIAGVLSATLYETPPATAQYSSFTSLGHLAIPILAGFESLLAVVAVAILFSVGPQRRPDLSRLRGSPGPPTRLDRRSRRGVRRASQHSSVSSPASPGPATAPSSCSEPTSPTRRLGGELGSGWHARSKPAGSTSTSRCPRISSAAPTP